MAIPPKGDPRRPVFWAILTLSVLAGLFILLGIAIGVEVAQADTQHYSTMLPLVEDELLVLIFVVVPGIIYLLSAIYLRRRREWAIVLGTIMTTIHLGLVVVAGINSISEFRYESFEEKIMSIFGWLLIGILGYLIYCLFNSFEGIKLEPFNSRRGFEVLPIEKNPPA